MVERSIPRRLDMRPLSPHPTTSLSHGPAASCLHIERIDGRTSVLAVAGSGGLERLPPITRALRELAERDARVLVDLCDCRDPDVSLLSAVRSQRHLSGGGATVVLVGDVAGAYGTRAEALEALEAESDPRWRIVSERVDAASGRISVWGEWDISNVSQLEAALQSAVERGRLEVAMELHDGAFVDVLCLRVLMEAGQRLAGLGGRLMLVSEDGSPERLLRLADQVGAALHDGSHLHAR
jgi:anti-anti-sigma factor